MRDGIFGRFFCLGFCWLSLQGIPVWLFWCGDICMAAFKFSFTGWSANIVCGWMDGGFLYLFLLPVAAQAVLGHTADCAFGVCWSFFFFSSQGVMQIPLLVFICPDYVLDLSLFGLYLPRDVDVDVPPCWITWLSLACLPVCLFVSDGRACLRL